MNAPFRTTAARAAALALLAAGLAPLLALATCGERESDVVSRSGDGAIVARGDPGAGPGAIDEGPVPPWNPGDPMPLRALLIGVGDYPEGSQFSDLRGPARDVELVRSILIDRFRADPARVRVLTDGDATLEGIVRAIDEHLLRQARPDEEVLLFYSGHGSRVLDATGIERGHRDSSLVAYDSRIDGRRGSHDVTDDVLYSLLHPLTERGVHVVAITDACHSGGVLRGSFQVRSAPPAESGVTSVDGWAFWPEGVPFLDDDQRKAGSELENYVHVGACSPEQRAFEYPFAEDGPHGLLTWALADVLRRTQPENTYAEVAVRTAARIQAIPGAPIQSVWVEGSDTQREVFGRRFHPVPDRFVLEPDGPRMRVQAGSVHGLQRGTVLRAVDEDGTEVGTLEVDRTAFGSASAHWKDRRTAPTDGRALYAEVVSQPADLPRLSVHASDVRLVAACDGSDWADVAVDPNRPYVLELEDGDRVTFRTAEGIPIWTDELVPAEESGGAPSIPVESMERAFRRETRFQALWQLADPDRRGALGDLRLEFVPPSDDLLVGKNARGERIEFAPVRFEPLDASSGFVERGGSARGELEVALPTFEKTADWTKGIPLTVLRVTNQNIDTVYIHVLSLNEAREIGLLFPRHGEKDRWSTMESPTKEIELELGAMTDAVFPLDRPMLERTLAIACTVPLDLKSLEHRAGPTDATRGESLPGVLEACVGGGLTRGSGRIEHPRGGWGVGWIDVWIHRKPE